MNLREAIEAGGGVATTVIERNGQRFLVTAKATDDPDQITITEEPLEKVGELRFERDGDRFIPLDGESARWLKHEGSPEKIEELLAESPGGG